MNDSSRSRGIYRNLAKLSNSPNRATSKSTTYYCPHYPVSALTQSEASDPISHKKYHLSYLTARGSKANSMSTSYRDAYRSYFKSEGILEDKSRHHKQSEDSLCDQSRRIYSYNSGSDEILKSPLRLSHYLSSKSSNGSVITMGTVPGTRTSNSDPVPTVELSKLSLEDCRPLSPPTKTRDSSASKAIPSECLTSYPNHLSSAESSPETAKSTGTSNSSNNSSVPPWSCSSRNSYIPNGFMRTSTTCDRRTGGLVGLNNLGNTCFMNSIIQCLSNTQPLLDYCLFGRYTSDMNPNSTMRGSLFTSYVSLMKDLWNPELNDSSTNPHQFKMQIQKFAPRFVGYAQQDSQEFLRYVLEGLHLEVNRVTKRPQPVTPDYAAEDKLSDREKAEIYWKRYLSMDNSEIVDIFVGQLMSTLECSECGFKSTTFDPFWDLSLPIPKKPNVSIMDCLRLFTSKDDLDGNERPVCGRCKVRRRCAKSFSIHKFPRILVLHLKRFSGERFRSKMSVLVDFPILDLNLSEFASPCCQQRRLRYNLYAVSNHSGSVYAGHYTAACKHPYRNSWFEYNDNRVRSTSIQSVVSSEAYVLFYELAE